MVDGLLGDQRYRTTSGDITLREVAGRLVDRGRVRATSRRTIVDDADDRGADRLGRPRAARRDARVAPGLDHQRRPRGRRAARRARPVRDRDRQRRRAARARRRRPDRDARPSPATSAPRSMRPAREAGSALADRSAAAGPTLQHPVDVGRRPRSSEPTVPVDPRRPPRHAAPTIARRRRLSEPSRRTPSRRRRRGRSADAIDDARLAHPSGARARRDRRRRGDASPRGARRAPTTDAAEPRDRRPTTAEEPTDG